MKTISENRKIVRKVKRTSSKKIISVYVDSETYQKLKEEAKNDKRSLSSLLYLAAMNLCKEIEN